MSEPTVPEDEPQDDDRQHSEAPAEGPPDEEQEDRPDVPRVHPEEPAEG